MKSRACRRTRRRLAGFAGQDLSAAEAEGVRAHLRACPPCRTEAGAFLRARRELHDGAWAGVPGSVDEGFFGSLYADIAAAAAAEPVEALEPRRSGRARVAAAAALLFGVGLWSVQVLWPANRGLLERPALHGAGIEPVSYDPASLIRPLGAEQDLDVDSDSQGLMGRLKLRTLEREIPGPWRVRSRPQPVRPLDAKAAGPEDPAGGRR